MVVTGLALGTVLGFVMQRGRFCVTGMIRDIFTLKTWRGFTALLIVIAVHAVGLAALTSAGVISPSISEFAPAPVIVGGFLFGLGIVLAGGCASGTWYRSGEGLVGSWIALAMYGLSAAAMNAGALAWLDEALASHTVAMTTIPASLGVSVWVFVIPFAAFVAFLAAKYLREEFSGPTMAKLPARKSGLAHLLAEKPWHFYSTAVIVGALGVLAWPLSAASGRNSGLGITTPSSDTMRFITTGDVSRINWGTLLVFGILIGAFFAAKASGEFRVRVPSGTQAIRSVVGGVLMGVGAVWAGGCTVGNGMVQTSLFSYQGWIALLFIALGVGVAAKLWLRPSDPVPGSSIGGDATPPQPSSSPSMGVDEGFSVTGSGNLLTATRPVGTAVGVAESSASGVGASSGLRQVGERAYALDTLGAVCPFPLVEAKQAMASLERGDSLVIDFDCTQATDAIPRWAANSGHSVTKFEATGDAGWTITVKKGS